MIRGSEAVVISIDEADCLLRAIESFAPNGWSRLTYSLLIELPDSGSAEVGATVRRLQEIVRQHADATSSEGPCS